MRVASFDLHAEAPEEVLAIAGDVSRSADVDAAVARVEGELGRIDVLVCSAGVPGDSLRTVDVVDEEWRRVMGINADGVFYCNRAVLRDGRARLRTDRQRRLDRGQGGQPDGRRLLGVEGSRHRDDEGDREGRRPDGVLVNCVAPAVIETPILDGITQEHIDYMVERIPMGRMGEPEEVAALVCWLASEVLVLDERRTTSPAVEPSTRDPMRYVRFRGPAASRSARSRVDTSSPRWRRKDRAARSETHALAEPYELAPIAAPEVWCAGVTYERSRDARVEESAVKDVYTLVYDAPRPELFLKDAAGRRTAGPGQPIGIRDDSTWSVPEPEIGVVLGEHGRIAGLTIGNDVSSRDIEGANPLYLPQAKIYAGACAIGPAIYIPESSTHRSVSTRVTDEYGQIVFEGETSTATMRRSYELVEWLLRDNPVPPGSVLLTGTGSSHPTASVSAPATSSRSTCPRSGDSSIPSSVPPS